MSTVALGGCDSKRKEGLSGLCPHVLCPGLDKTRFGSLIMGNLYSFLVKPIFYSLGQVATI